MQYVDTLAKDLGLNTNRKSNPFSEMFASYRPSDWKGFIPEFLEAENRRLVNVDTKASNGHAANGHAANGKPVNGHIANGHGS